MKVIQVTLQRGDVAKDAWISGCVRIERPGDGQSAPITGDHRENRGTMRCHKHAAKG